MIAPTVEETVNSIFLLKCPLLKTSVGPAVPCNRSHLQS
jgi:hypothetical protein